MHKTFSSKIRAGILQSSDLKYTLRVVKYTESVIYYHSFDLKLTTQLWGTHTCYYFDIVMLLLIHVFPNSTHTKCSYHKSQHRLNISFYIYDFLGKITFGGLKAFTSLMYSTIDTSFYRYHKIR